ncbi:MAG: hypothetical protein ACXAC7_11760 [Candidatus Hodarchaeales archaeon]|jgi:hypothetical protein
MKFPIVVIPTYWRKGNLEKQDFVYDHPTDLINPEETISKTLESLVSINGSFDVLVIGVPTRPSIGNEVDKKVKDIIKALNLPYKVQYFGSNEFSNLKNHFNSKFPKEIADIPSNQGYSNIRNLCLLIPHLLGYQTVVLIDDDELITDKDFIRKSTEFIGKEINGKILGLILGFYRNRDGSFYLDESNIPWWELVWNKINWMNEAFKIIEDPGNRLVDTPFAFGGNMVITRKCWINVPFDPLIRRGEDMDYLRNVKFSGFDAKLDKTLSIIHCPPQSKTSYLTRFQEDIYRFLYAKAKIKFLGLKSEHFDPYPGYFYKQTEGKVILTELLYHIFHNFEELIEVLNSDELFKELRKFSSIFKEASRFANTNSGSFKNFQERWQIMFKEGFGHISFKLVDEL